MCVDPSKEIHPMAATKSKLDNLNLSHQSPFDEDVANTVLSFLNRLKKPMCMIAHYGFKFDFPILKSEIANVGMDFSEDVFCADSLPVFRTCQRLAPGVPYSYTLENVYKRIYNNQPELMHEAEADVKMLFWAAAATPRPFLNAVANTAVPIATINKCW
ncbi:three-prime repair exonuclease 1-like [Daphnia pulicaria]|uniref:three-prime repair exonuclease 1-like n=1 Tax=Daphnia pulicaria TaxID=35523 RepID=UPI001EEBB63E|nr:three-prime repair exonuclease 1-like [Daphnia pulicaria]